MPPSEVRERWRPTDVALASAYLDHKASMHACGHPVDECMSEKADYRNRAEREFTYKAETRMCHACAEAEKYRESHELKPGQVVVTRKVPLAAAPTNN